MNDKSQNASVSPMTDFDLHLFHEGNHLRLFRKMGSHLVTQDGTSGVYFAVWAPNATRVAVIGDFNGWDPGPHPLERISGSGVWAAFVPGVKKGAKYKYKIDNGDYHVDKADPFAVHAETPPEQASIVWDLEYAWSDDAWMKDRAKRMALDAPMSIYEVHLGSWMRGEGNAFLGYREIAPRLAEYAKKMGFTHVELLPIMEHPFYGSWGYQITGFFAPTSRLGTPQDLMYLIDVLHQHGVGVILDWVPSHFPNDAHGLAYFDGTHLFEHADPRQGYHPDWKSAIFNYGRFEVKSFLLSSAMYWLDVFHVDGLRVDAVASMLYLDYSRNAGEWIPNKHGGRENLEAIDFLRQMNTTVFGEHPGVQTIAEESTAWPMVSRPIYLGGLGFGLKWDMGWMHDTLKYAQTDPLYRTYHHNQLTFRQLYAFSENFVLPFSHDEVVHGKGSMLGKMPGDEWQRFANLRLFLAYMFAQNAKKLLFMGAEFGQYAEWNHDRSLDWHLLQYPLHEGVQRTVADLNRLYASTPALHELDCGEGGFEWIDVNNSAESVIAILRKGKTSRQAVIAVLNFTPIPRQNYRIGAPYGGVWREALNTDGRDYGGSGQGNMGSVEAAPVPHHGRPFSLTLTVPPLGAVFLLGESPPEPA